MAVLAKRKFGGSTPKSGLPAKSGTAPARATGSGSQPLSALPWYRLFKDYGFSDVRIPRDPPPETKEYPDIYDWVTKDIMFVEDPDRALVIDIWMGRIDPLNYTPVPKLSTDASSLNVPDANPSKPKSAKPARRAKFGAKRKPAESPSPSIGM